MQRSCFSSAAILIIVAAITAPAGAADIRVDFTALVDNVSDYTGVFGGSIAPGDTIRGTYWIDSDATDTNGLPAVGDYWHHGGSHGMSASVGGWTFTSQPVGNCVIIEVLNNHTGLDAHLVRSHQNNATPPLPDGATVESVEWSLQDNTMAALDGIALPLYHPILADWPSNHFSIHGSVGEWDSWHISGHVIEDQSVLSYTYPVIVEAIDDVGGYLEGLAGVDELGSLTMSYHLAPQDDPKPLMRIYNFNGRPYGLTLDLAGLRTEPDWTYPYTLFEVQVHDDIGGDDRLYMTTFATVVDPPFAGDPPIELWWNLLDIGAEAITGVDLPLERLHLADWVDDWEHFAAFLRVGPSEATSVMRIRPLDGFADYGVRAHVISVDDNYALLDGQVAADQPVIARYRYYAPKQDESPLAEVADYYFHNRHAGLEIVLPAYRFTSDAEDPAVVISVIDDFAALPGDRFEIRAYAVEVAPQPEDPITIDNIGLLLSDPTGQALDEVALPLDAPDPLDFPSTHVLHINGYETADPSHTFTVICEVEAIGTDVVGVPDDAAPIPRLAAPALTSRPNPFNPRTEIAFAMARGGQVDLAVYDLQGRRLRTLVAGERPAGQHVVTWDGTDGSGRGVASGVYLAVLRTPEGQAARRLCLVK